MLLSYRNQALQHKYDFQYIIQISSPIKTLNLIQNNT